MRIVFLAPCRGLAGGLRVIAAYGEALRLRGHDVTIAYPRKRESLRRRLRNDMLRALARVSGRTHGPLFDFLDFFDREYHGRLLALNTAPGEAPRHPLIERADCVVATAWETAEWLRDLRLHSSKQMYLIQGYESWNSVPERLHATYRLPFQKIFISRWLRDQVATAAGDRAILDCPIISNGCNFRAIPEGLIGRRRTYDVGFVYSAAAHKNAAAAFDILARLRESRPELRVAIFGGERPPESLLPDNAEFWYRPSGERIQKIYADTACWLITSREEGFCLPALEAMRQGSVVAAYDNGGIRDVVASDSVQFAPGIDWNNSRDAIVVPQNEAEALREGLATLLDDHGLRMTLSRHARARSLNFDWSLAVQKFEALIFAAPEAARNEILKVTGVSS